MDPAEAVPMTGKGDRPEPKPRHENTSIYTNKEPSRRKSQLIRRWKVVAITFMVISACLIAGIIAVALVDTSGDSAPSITCKEKLVDQSMAKGSAEECMLRPKPASGKSKIFSGLSTEQMDKIVRFMHSKKELNLVAAANATIKDNYIFSIDDYLPSKKDVTDWLDGKRPAQPQRKARVIVFKGKTQEVVDYLVSPIPNPTRYETAYINRKRDVELSWKSRPICNIVEVPAVHKFVIGQLTKEVEGIYFESFTDGTCKHISTCFYANMATRTVFTSSKRHLVVWFFVSPALVEDYYMYALPFYLVLSASNDSSGYEIVAVYYNSMKFNSLRDLKNEYYKNANMRYALPDMKKHHGKYGSPRYIADGETVDQKRRPPQQYYPDGARFSVTGQHIEWLGWEFDIHFRTLTGLQLFDVKYKKERIAYELSMQDVLVLYSGNAPDDFFKSYFDVSWSIGRSNLPLVRGIDCPSTAMYLNSTVYAVGSDHGIVLNDAVCVFEHSNSIPLRHHYSTKFFEWGYRYAFSMPDSVLIVRQTINVWNYDYIFDYEFHQNGVVEVKVASTGYVAVSTNIPNTITNRGLVINPDFGAVANLHQHLFNFKLDLDIAGTKNNFKTVNVEYQRHQTDFSANKPWYQMVTTETEIKREADAALSYDFNKPKQYVIYNKDAEVYQGSSLKKGYKIQSNSFSKVVIPTDWPLLEGAASWTKYQIAVTKYDNNERTTASYFTQGDPFDAAISLDKYRSGDQSLDDVDLVAWTTVGLLHLPTYEDLPVTSTPGKVLSISLIPFNYFPRDPSIHSRDAAVFYSAEFNKTGDYFYKNDTCPSMSFEPFLNVD